MVKKRLNSLVKVVVRPICPLLSPKEPFRSIPLCGADFKLTFPRGSFYSVYLASHPDEAGREAAMGSRKSPRFHFTCRTHDPPPINLPVSLTAVSFAVKHKSDKPRTVRVNGHAPKEGARRGTNSLALEFHPHRRNRWMFNDTS